MNPQNNTPPKSNWAKWCDHGIIVSFCAMIFLLPASIAYLDSFAALAIFLFFVKRVARIICQWPLIGRQVNPREMAQGVLKELLPVQSILNLPLLVLTGAFLLSTILSQYPHHSFLAFVGKYLKCVFLYFSFIEVFSDENKVWIFLRFFFLSAFITALSGLYQHHTGRDFIRHHQVGKENFVLLYRVSSTFYGANGFGAYLLPIIGIILSLGDFWVRRKKWIMSS